MLAIKLRKHNLEQCLAEDKQRKIADCANKVIFDVHWGDKLSHCFMCLHLVEFCEQCDLTLMKVEKKGHYGNEHNVG